MFGDILSCKIQTDDNGVSLGYGFVHYTTKSAPEKALALLREMEGQSLHPDTNTYDIFIPD